MSDETTTKKALKLFEYQSKNIYKCTVCNKNYNGAKPSNLLQHLRGQHKNVYEQEVESKIDPITAEKMQMELLQCMTEKVTINGRPFSSLNDSGYVKSIKATLNLLRDNGFGINLGDRKYSQIKECIANTANQIIDAIKSEINGRPVSLMLDTATKNHNSIFGVSVRYMVDGKIVQRCIGMTALTDRHTSANLAMATKKCADKFGIGLKQIKSITTDNAYNVVAIIDYIDEETLAAFEEDLQRTFSNSDQMGADSNEPNPDDEAIVSEEEIQDLVDEILNEDALRTILDDTEEYEGLLNEVIGGLAHHMNEHTTGVRCGAHTLSLIVRGATKRSNIHSVLVLCRRVAKLLRTASYKREARENGFEFKLPHINVVTRWDSDYTMVSLKIHPNDFFL